MKKNILIICSNMKIGGFQKSLINLLQEFDYSLYNVDLFLIERKGEFLNLIPKDVNIVDVRMEQTFFLDISKSLKTLIHKKKFFLLFFRMLCACLSFIDKGYCAWLMSKYIPKVSKKYDVAIDYNGQYILYYLVDKINADVKISYFHSDYAEWDYYKNIDKYYYKKVNFIVTVSELCAVSLKKYFPSCADKIQVIENIVSLKTTKVSSNEVKIQQDYQYIKLMTIGRVCANKGIILALETAELLAKKNIKFKWYFIGPVDKLNEYQKIIVEKKLENYIYFIGATIYPYDYMRNADIIVHPSKFEGKAVAVEEAKILNKPIVATNYSTVINQIENHITGIIVDMNPVSLYKGIVELIENKDIKNRIIYNQKILCKGNANEVNKLYNLFDVGGN